MGEAQVVIWEGELEPTGEPGPAPADSAEGEPGHSRDRLACCVVARLLQACPRGDSPRRPRTGQERADGFTKNPLRQPEPR